MPLSCTEWLPAVKPSFGVRVVSGVTECQFLERHFEFFGGYLQQGSPYSLAELGLAGEDRRRPVRIDLDPRVEFRGRLQAAG